MKYLSLSKDKKTIVDDELYDYLNQWKWKYHVTGYALRNQHIKGSKPYRSIVIRMHRLIANTPKHLFTDHINGDRLDNRKSNLRHCDKKQNSQNMSKKKLPASSIYKGVYFSKKQNRFHARVKVNGKSIHAGFFKSEYDAAVSYNKYAIKFFGEFANLNPI